jgi:DNA-binding NtrC family response regulator
MRSVLIVDDNQAFAENLAEIVGEAGHRAVVVTSGAEALACAQAERFDLLVSDMRMPVMGGAELVHRVRRADPGLPAVVVTAYTNDDDLQAARQEGLLAVLPKPVPLEHLVELVEAARRDGLVALVEDDVHLSDNLSEVLRARGFAAVTAASVLETERLGDVRPFAALVDLRVKGGPDGEAMRRLTERFPGLPVLIITAHSHALATVDSEARGRVFTKPFSTEKLMEAVERLHGSPRP